MREGRSHREKHIGREQGEDSDKEYAYLIVTEHLSLTIEQ